MVEGGKRLTRRDAARAIAGSVAGAVMVVSSEGKSDPAGQLSGDPRIAGIEHDRGKPLTSAQRKAVLEAIKEHEESSRKAREFSVPDGTEPDFVFRPAAKPDT